MDDEIDVVDDNELLLDDAVVNDGEEPDSTPPTSDDDDLDIEDADDPDYQDDSGEEPAAADQSSNAEEEDVADDAVSRPAVPRKYARQMHRKHKQLSKSGELDRAIFMAAVHLLIGDPADRRKKSDQLLKRAQFLYVTYIKRDSRVMTLEFVRRINDDFNVCLRIWQKVDGKMVSCHSICYNCRRREVCAPVR